MFLRIFLTSVTFLVSLNAYEPELPLSKEDKKRIEKDAVDRIKGTVYRLKYKSDYYDEFSHRQLEDLTSVNLDKPETEKSIFEMRKLVPGYEEKMRRERMELFMAKQREKLQKDIRLLERDLSVLKELSPKEEEQKFKMMLMGSTKEKEFERNQIKSSLRSMEALLSRIETKVADKNVEVEEFQARVSEAESELAELAMRVEAMNGKKNLKDVAYSEQKGLREDSKTFEESVREVIPGEIFGAGVARRY